MTTCEACGQNDPQHKKAIEHGAHYLEAVAKRYEIEALFARTGAAIIKMGGKLPEPLSPQLIETRLECAERLRAAAVELRRKHSV